MLHRVVGMGGLSGWDPSGFDASYGGGWSRDGSGRRLAWLGVWRGGWGWEGSREPASAFVVIRPFSEIRSQTTPAS